MTPSAPPSPASPTGPTATPTTHATRPAADAAPAGEVTPEEGMRFYTAILGREPTVDPDAPDLLPRLRPDEPPAKSLADELSRSVRDELSRKLQMKLERRPTWRELMDAMTTNAGRRIDDARKRLNHRKAA